MLWGVFINNPWSKHYFKWYNQIKSPKYPFRGRLCAHKKSSISLNMCKQNMQLNSNLRGKKFIQKPHTKITHWTCFFACMDLFCQPCLGWVLLHRSDRQHHHSVHHLKVDRLKTASTRPNIRSFLHRFQNLTVRRDNMTAKPGSCLEEKTRNTRGKKVKEKRGEKQNPPKEAS